MSATVIFGGEQMSGKANIRRGGVDVRSLADAANHDWQKAAT